MLAVPPDVNGGPWLGARLVAGWEAVDDRLWRVDFWSVTVSLLGFKLFTKEFKDTTRVWAGPYNRSLFSSADSSFVRETPAVCLRRCSSLAEKGTMEGPGYWT